MVATRLRAVEFFSGIGAFKYAGAGFGVHVVAAFDQGQDANRVYEHNFGEKPSGRNLDSIGMDRIPEAEIWWLSPPCTPYSRRGKMLDDVDPRSASLRNLIALLQKHPSPPQILFVENVVPFLNSRMFACLSDVLQQLGYALHTVQLCPTMFGVPMKRPRIFVIATRIPITVPQPERVPLPLRSFLTEHPELLLDSATIERYADGLNILTDLDSSAESAICFTSGYGHSFRAAGSFLPTPNGGVRRFAPSEILRLFGFGDDFGFPADMPLSAQWRLVGNSVDVRCIRHLLRSVEGAAERVKTSPELRMRE